MDITLHGFARFSLPLVVLKELWCCCDVVVVLLSCRCHVVVLSLRGDEGCHLRATVCWWYWGVSAEKVTHCVFSVCGEQLLC